MFFGKKKEEKTYSFDQVKEIIKIKGLVDSCNEPICFKRDKSYMTMQLERMVRTEERWANFVKENPEFKDELKMEFEILLMNKKMLTLRIENPDL